MAPAPYNGTGIYYVDYAFRGQAHTMLFRTDAATGPASLQEPVSAFLGELALLMDATWVVTGARGSAAGSSLTLPMPAPATPTLSSATLEPVNYPRFVSFVGRGITTGRRWLLSVYGLTITTPNSYRFTTGVLSALDNAASELANMASTDLVTVGGDAPYFQAYYNVGYNSYWERNQRG